MQELRAVSSRAAITATRFTNHYEWGNFKGDPGTWMERYFDAFLYFANWGTHELMLRLPRRVLEPATARRYCRGDAASARAKGGHVILEFLSEAEGSDWYEEEDEDGSLSVPWRPPPRPARGRAAVPRRPSRQVPAPPERWITIPVPAIIDEGLFESAREQLAENRRRARQRPGGVRYLLQGLLVCGECGYALCGHWQPRRTPGREYRYYRCCGTEGYRFHGQRRCDARVVPVEALDGAVWAEVCRVLEAPARVVQEYQRRLEAARTGSRRPELE